MSTFTYHKPGIGNASSYIVSGVPWYTSSLAPALSTTSKVVNFPRVTNYVVVKNNSTTNDTLRFTFNNDNIVDNTNYVTLEGGESFSGELRTTDVHFISDSETPVPFTVVAGLTNIERQEMTSTTPTAPNLLAWVQKQKLIADDPDGLPEGDWFGYAGAIDLSDNLLVIGARRSEGSEPGTGAAYIFQSSSLGYQQTQKLTASFDTSGNPDPQEGGFGYSVATNKQGNIVAIGAHLDDENGINTGAVYIFQSSSVGYQQVQKLTASTAGFFGRSISLNGLGNILFAENNFDDSVLIFQSSSLGYQQTQKLTASFDTSGNPETGYAGFGVQSVVSSETGETLFVGAGSNPENGSLAGAVYIFQSSSVGYQQVQKLTASFGTDGNPEVSPEEDWFGQQMATNKQGNIIAIGAYLDEENGGSDAGSVYIFQSSSVGYQQVQKLTASFGTDGSPEVSPENDKFGNRISMNATGEILAINSRDDEEAGNLAGAVYIFQSSSVGYQEVAKLTASFQTDGSPEVLLDNERFGRQATILNQAGDTLLVGAYGNDENGIDAGSFYIFEYTRDY